MTLTSSSFEDGDIIPDRFTAAVSDPVSPSLAWHDPPKGTVSFAIIMHDLEGIRDHSSRDIVHWIVFDIPADVHSLPEHMPIRSMLTNGAVQTAVRPGRNGYAGPGARISYHHYTFEIYALDSYVRLGPDASRGLLLEAMDGHVLAKAALVGRFHR